MGIVTNLPDMGQLAGLRGDGITSATGGLGGRIMASKSCADWSPGLVAAVKESLKMYFHRLDADGAEIQSDPQLQKIDMAAWREHVRQQHAPFRRDCRVCLEYGHMATSSKKSQRFFFLHYVSGFGRAVSGWPWSGNREVLPI